MRKGPGRLAGALFAPPGKGTAGKIGFLCQNIKTVEFTEEKGLTNFMSTEKCGKTSGANLHNVVETFVEVVEALKSKEFTKDGMEEAGEELPNSVHF